MDQFADWQKLLGLAQAHKTKAALREAIGTSGLKLVDGEPMSGYFRCAAVKDGPLLPVAIWREGERLYVQRAGESVTTTRVWPHCVWNPVSYEWFEQYEKQGRWPDEPAQTADAPTETATTEAGAGNNRQTIGGNNPPVEDEATALKSQIEAAKGVAEQDYTEIITDDQAAAAQALRSRLLSLSGDADKKREAEKRPHFEKAKAVDTKWQPVVKLGKDAADWLRGKLSDYATRKADKDAEDRRIALAEEVRLAAERATAEPDADAPPVETAPAPAPAAPEQTTIKGASGRAATIRTIKVAKVVDYDKAYAHLKAIPEIKKAIDTVAQRFISAGNSVPGVEVHERRDVA